MSRQRYLARLSCKSAVTRNDPFTHGSPRDHLYPAELLLRSTSKYDEVFAAVQRRLFVGRYPQPNVIYEDRSSQLPSDVGNQLDCRVQQKVIVNPGALGRPHLGSFYASYALVTEDTVAWRCVDYDYERTLARMRKHPGIHSSIVERFSKAL